MVELARQRAPGARVVLATAERLPFPGRAFSAVAMSIVFFFLDDPVGALRECRRVLCRGGRPHRLHDRIGAARDAGCARADCEPRPFLLRAELADLAERAGLRAVAVTREAGGQLLTGRT